MFKVDNDIAGKIKCKYCGLLHKINYPENVDKGIIIYYSCNGLEYVAGIIRDSHQKEIRQVNMFEYNKGNIMSEKQDVEDIGDDFITELSALINKHSMENCSNTPDFLLAKYLYGCLRNYEVIVKRRDEWYGDEHFPSKGVEEKPGK